MRQADVCFADWLGLCVHALGEKRVPPVQFGQIVARFRSPGAEKWGIGSHDWEKQEYAVSAELTAENRRYFRPSAWRKPRPVRSQKRACA